jgi:hypothetical protein
VVEVAVIVEESVRLLVTVVVIVNVVEANVVVLLPEVVVGVVALV